MNHTATVAFVIAGGLLLFGGVTCWLQLRGWRALRARTHVPSDEFGYLRNRYRRRALTGGLLALVGGLIAGAYLSGLELKVDALTAKGAATDPNQPDGAKRDMTPEEKQLVRVWVGYWVVVLVLVFVVIGLAFTDALATRRYAMQQYQVIREDHEAKLRRDLAVYKAQKEASRGGRGGNRMGGGDDE